MLFVSNEMYKSLNKESEKSGITLLQVRRGIARWENGARGARAVVAAG